MNQVIASGSVTPMSITTAIERLSRLREKVAAHFLLGVMLAADPTTIGNRMTLNRRLTIEFCAMEFGRAEGEPP